LVYSEAVDWVAALSFVPLTGASLPSPSGAKMATVLTRTKRTSSQIRAAGRRQ
jgi:hypothetical protein